MEMSLELAKVKAFAKLLFQAIFSAEKFSDSSFPFARYSSYPPLPFLHRFLSFSHFFSPMFFHSPLIQYRRGFAYRCTETKESVTRAVSTRYIFVYVLLSIGIPPAIGIPVVVCYFQNYISLNETYRVKFTLFRRVTLFVAISRDDRKFYLGERAVEISRFQRFHI